MNFYSALVFIPLLLLEAAAAAAAYGEPFDVSQGERINDIDHGTRSDYKQTVDPFSSSAELDSDFNPGATNAKETTVTISAIDGDETPLRATGQRRESVEGGDDDDDEGSAMTNRENPVAWLLAPLARRIQFSPQTLFRDKLDQLRETLDGLGWAARREDDGKRFNGAAGLLHLAGLNDSGFYTNRLDPAGFFGGNGWFANKGGIIGGPGALLSTGSVLTDYPTPYRK